MARKKAQRKQERTLVPHRTPNLSVLLERAKAGDSVKDLRAYLDAGGSPVAVVQVRGLVMLQVPLLHSMAYTSAHPHRHLAESVRLLMDAGADINAKAKDPDGDERTALMCAAERTCCTAVPDVLLRAGANPCVCSAPNCITSLHVATQIGSAR
jgi:hypothetical protein